MALPALEPFTYTVDTDLPNPPWTELGGVSSNTVRSNGTQGFNNGAVGIDAIVVWNRDAFSNDQYSQVVSKYTGLGNGTGYIYLAVRATRVNNSTSVSANGTFYWFWSDGGSDTAILKQSAGGTPTSLSTANATTYVSGDLFNVSIAGSSITVKKNGSTILTATDSAIASGAAGVGGESSVIGLLFDDWEGGNVAAGTGIPPGLGPVVGMEQLFHLDASLMR